jgi:hypothetical protein
MKTSFSKILFAAVLPAVLLLTSCSSKPSEEEKVEMESFGPAKIVVEDAVSVSELLKKMEGNSEEVEITIKGEIAEVCSKAGCWINVKKPDGSTFMVRFKDHFTIPSKTKTGTEAYLHGVAYWDTISVDMLQHFAEDAGKSEEEIAKITSANFELAFEADGITFPKEIKKK